MKLFLIALPPEWEKRLCKILSRRGHSPRRVEAFRARGGNRLRTTNPRSSCFMPTVNRGCLAVLPPLARPPAFGESANPDLRFRAAGQGELARFQHAGVDFILPAAFTDSELEFRLSVAECLLKSTSPTGDVAPPPDRRYRFHPRHRECSLRRVPQFARQQISQSQRRFGAYFGLLLQGRTFAGRYRPRHLFRSRGARAADRHHSPAE